MGLAAIVLYPIQIYVIPKLQRQVNLLGKARVRQVRRLADRIGETVGGVRDIRANDTTQYERARFSKELGVVFNIRYKIYKKKFFIKFLNNFMAQLGPFFFYSIGGYLVIMGDLTLGALVAVVGAHKELYSPWKELLSHYQLTWDSQIKFEQVVAQFDPAGLRDQGLQTADLSEPLSLDRPAARRQRDAHLGGRTGAAGRRQLRGAAAGAHRGPGARRQRQGRAAADPGQPARSRRRARADQRRRGAQASGGGDRPADDLRRLPGADLRRHDRRQPVLRTAASPRAAAGAGGRGRRDVQAGAARGRALGQFALRSRSGLDRLPGGGPERPRGGGAGGGAGAGHGAPGSRRLPHGPARHDRSRGSARGRRRRARGAARHARAAPGAALQPPGRGVRRRSLQHQCHARREPAVRRAGRRDLRHRASCGASVRAADPRAGRPDGHPGRGRLQGRRHHGRAVRRSAARSRVLPPVQLHRRRRSARIPGADHPGRSEPAGHAQSR